MNYKIAISYMLILGFFVFLMFAYVKYNTKTLENESSEIKRSILSAIRNDDELKKTLSIGMNNKEEISLSEGRIIKIIEEFVKNHPDIVAENLERYYADRELNSRIAIKKNLSALSDELFHSTSDPVAGNIDGKIRIVEFFDYDCPFCKKMAIVKMKILQQNKDVNIIFKELPIFGEHSKLATKISLGVHFIDPSKYFAFQSAVLNSGKSLGSQELMSLAKDLGVDAAKVGYFLSDAKNTPYLNSLVKKNLDLYNKLKIAGTPSYIIEDEVVSGYISAASMQAIIDRKRRELDQKRLNNNEGYNNRNNIEIEKNINVKNANKVASPLIESSFSSAGHTSEDFGD